MTNQPQEPQMQPPPPEPPKYRFRAALYIGIPLTIGIFFWLLTGIEPSFSFGAILDTLHVNFPERYVHLTCLGIVLIVVLFIVKQCNDK